ncbi:MAG: FapA family protein [Melioribacteraceae bacterium]|nr:FapA family protein [Melioribacteraceae bacterium]
MDTANVVNEIKEPIFNEMQLLCEPLINSDAELVLNVIEDGKLYSSDLEKIRLNIKITENNTALFCTKSQSDISNENINHSIEQNYFNLDRDINNEMNNISSDGNKYFATIDGVFLIDGNTPKIIPLIYDTLFKVRVSEDSVCVFLDLFPPAENQNPPKLEDIINEISKLGEVQNIDKEVITNSINLVMQKNEPLNDIIVSMGDYPFDGKDAWLEICVKKVCKDSNTPENNYQSKSDSFLSLGKDELVAKIHPLVEGSDGVDVFGSTIKHVKAKDIKLKLTSNIYADAENNNLIYSKVDGFVEIYQNTIYIKEQIDIKGNIDANTGNIKAYGSILVYGDIVNEAKVNLSQNLEVRGYAGDAEIEVGKDAVIKGGFLGSGKGSIKTGGNLEVKFVENQKVYCRGSLTISKEAINSELYIRDKLISTGSQFTIIGGYAIATESIELYSAGNEFNTTTVLEVGIDYQKKFSIRDFSKKLELLKKEIEIVDAEIIELSSIRRKSTKQIDRVKLLAHRHTEIANEMELLKEERTNLCSEINTPTSAKIIVHNTIFPGVKIVINGKQKLITERLRSRTFMLSKENEIVTV